MLRTLIFALALGAAPSLSAAEEFPQSAVGIDVVGDDGTVVGRVNAVERDASGRIVAVEIAGQEPANAPYASRALVAEDRDGDAQERQLEHRRVVGGDRTRIR